MPDFSKAEVSDESIDLTAYRTFLKRLTVGQAVSLPLDAGETPRGVMRQLNTAARQSDMRLARLPAEDGAVRFRVLPAEKRAMRLTDEAKRARVEKARAPRARRRTEPAPAAATERPDPTQIEAPVETGQAHSGRAAGESPSEDPVTHELVPPEQQVREPDAQQPLSRGRRSRRPGAS
jgi:hypothetical protein